MATVNPLDIVPVSTSTDQQWISFYDSLKDALGKKDASIVFLEFWSRRGGDIEANTVFFRNEMEKRGIEITEEGIGSYIAEFLDDTWGVVSGIFSGVGTAGKTVGIILLIIVIVFVFRFAKNGANVNYLGTGVRI